MTRREINKLSNRRVRLKVEGEVSRALMDPWVLACGRFRVDLDSNRPRRNLAGRERILFKGEILSLGLDGVNELSIY